MHSQVRSDINVTPLVDVAMVVLIIFMVVTPLVSQGPEVTLPVTVHPQRLVDDANRTTVTVRTDGSVFVDGIALPREALAGALRGLGNEATVLVRADGRVAYREVREILDQLAENGSSTAALETRQER